MKVFTASGSTYVFDNEAMTWERENKNAGHASVKTRVPRETHDLPAIVDTGINSGILRAPVEPRLGERLTFYCREFDWVVTTQVVGVVL